MFFVLVFMLAVFMFMSKVKREVRRKSAKVVPENPVRFIENITKPYPILEEIDIFSEKRENPLVYIYA